MIDKWFSEEVARATQKNKRLVITDSNGEGKFLLDFLPKGYIIFYVNTIDDELFARFKTESDHAGDKVLFYSTIPASKLVSLQEYVQTCGCIKLDDTDSYLRSLIFNKLKKNTAISKGELLITAKLSRDKSEEWLKSILDGLSKPLDVKEYILQMLSDPSKVSVESDNSIWKSVSEEIYKLIGKPNTGQSADIFSKEISSVIFEGLAKGTISDSLLAIYYQWIDSKTLCASLPMHLAAFKMPPDVNLLDAHPDHCFDALDKKLFALISKRIEAGMTCDDILVFIIKRVNSPKAYDSKPEWLRCLKTLLEYRSKGLDSIDNLNDFALYYKEHFAKVDTAMRKLYVAWLGDEKVLRPIQHYYEILNKVVLEKWYDLNKQYKQNQLLYLNSILSANNHCAVIVGDGLRLEIADKIADLVKNSHFDCKIERTFGYCALPSITEVGMSMLYGIGEPTKSAQERFDNLKKDIPDVEIKQLDKLNDSDTASKLVLCFGDIDQVGEKKQLQGLKDIDSYEEQLAVAIGRLLDMGYNKVYVTTDHGFVITGILDESDKIEAPSDAGTKVEERYILSDTEIFGGGLIEKKGNFLNYRYAYFAKTDKPFKTKGAYGYAHGGLTPQECIIPMYCFSSGEQAFSICVSIQNKSELCSISGNYYKLKVKASGDASGLFNNSVTVKIQRYTGETPVSGGSIITLSAGEAKEMEFELPKVGEEKIVIVDANTKKQYDFCIVKKSNDRDLGGLL